MSMLYILEQNNNIHFLDMTIEKENNKLKLNVHRKLMLPITKIHNNSLRSYNEKRATYFSMINRAKNCINDVNDLN